MPIALFFPPCASLFMIIGLCFVTGIEDSNFPLVLSGRYYMHLLWRWGCVVLFVVFKTSLTT